MPPKKAPHTALAEKLLHGLQDLKISQASSYPPTMKELAAFVDREATPALLTKAVAARKPFGENAVLLQAKNLDSPVALKGDEACAPESSADLPLPDGTGVLPLETHCRTGKAKKQGPGHATDRAGMPP